MEHLSAHGGIVELPFGAIGEDVEDGVDVAEVDGENDLLYRKVFG